MSTSAARGRRLVGVPDASRRCRGNPIVRHRAADLAQREDAPRVRHVEQLDADRRLRIRVERGRGRLPGGHALQVSAKQRLAGTLATEQQDLAAVRQHTA